MSSQLTYANQIKNNMKKTIILFLLCFCANFTIAQEREVTGVVTDTEGETIPGVTVQIKGTTRGTITDIDGFYRIQAGPEEVLVFSFVGMQTKERLVEDQEVIDVVMEFAVGVLDEVVVVGYGVQERASVVGAISQVSGDRLRTVRTGGSVENTLQGRIPGLTIIMPDASPGEEGIGYYGKAGLQMTIRGTSAMGNNAPLLIVDGVERSFSNLDPNEINSITVLKDASATAVYGVKGANGVIIVDTKRGRAGAVQFEYSSSVSVKEPTLLPEYLNAYETMKLRNEALRNDGMWDRITPDWELEHYKNQDLPYLYPDFNWMDYYFSPGIDHQHNLNARGGTDFVQYFVSIGFLSEGDVFNTGNDFPYQFDSRNAHYWHERYNFRNNLDFNLTNSTKLAINLGGNIKVFNKPIDTFTQERWFQSVTSMPFYPAEAVQIHPDDRTPYNQDGRRPFLNPNHSPSTARLLWEGGLGFWRHKGNQTNVDVTLEQQLDFITEGLSAAATYSYNNDALYRQTFNLPNLYGYFLDPRTESWTRFDRDGTVDFNTPQPKLQMLNDGIFQGFRSHYYQGRVNFRRTFEDVHNLNLIGVFSRRESRGIANFPSYEESWVARSTYNYDRRYFLEASVAHTGSEKFAPGLRFGTFPSFAGGWTISNEEFFAPLEDYVDQFRIRYSWGRVGSDAGIARWLYVSEYQNVGGSVGFGYPLNYYGFIGEGPVPVPNATWETARMQNLGFELSLFQNLINLNVDLFDERRTDMLQTRQRVPTWAGVPSIQGNIGETKSHGIEIELGVNYMFDNGLFLFFNGNVSMSENRVVFWDESEFTPFHLKAEGKPVDIARRIGWYTPGTGIVDVGFYQDFDELFMYPTVAGGNPIPGDLAYLDFVGNGNVGSIDRVVAEHPITPYTTFNATFGSSFRNWSFDATFYGISQNQQPLRQGGMFFLFPFTQNRENAYTAHLDRWTPDNRNPQFPSHHFPATGHYNYQISNFGMVNGQYIRLRNVRLGYNLEHGSFQQFGIRSIELSLIGTNLWTWRRRDWGADPEGFNFGQDFGAYPQMRRYTFEVRVMF